MTLRDDRRNALWDTTHLLRRLNPHCAQALEAAANLCQTRLTDEVTVEHWLLKLIEAGDGDIPAILHNYTIDIDSVWDALLGVVDRQPRNLRGKPALSPQLAAMLGDAWLHASSENDDAHIRSGNLLQAIADAPYILRAHDAWPLLAISSTQIERVLPRVAHRSCESETESEAVDREAETPHRTASTAAANGVSPAKQAAPASAGALARFAIDLTDKVRRSDIDPVFGRDREIQQMVDILARRRKNNPTSSANLGSAKPRSSKGWHCASPKAVCRT
jgi:type VI secretion system protein VasG